MRVVIFHADSNGCFPVPAVRGGAVPSLIEHILQKTDIHKDVKLTMVSYYNADAVKEALLYTHVDFIWIKVPKLLKKLDSIFYKIYVTLFPKKKAISFISLFSLFYYLWSGSRILKEKDFDKVLLENNVFLAWIIRLSGFNGRFYYHLHNLPRTMAGCASVYDKCSGFYNVSRFISERLISALSPICQIPSNKCHEYYNCIDTDKFAPVTDAVVLDQYRKKYNVDIDEYVIIYVGRLSKEKGIDKLLEAALRLKYNIKILITGSIMFGNSSNEQDAYSLYIRELASKLGSNVVFTGFVSQTELPILYSLANIAVLPSIWDEPAGLTMIEAMACGVPVITCRVGGIPEYVGNDAILLDRDDNLVENIRLNIEMLLSNIEMSRDYSIRGRKRILENFNLDIFYKKFVEYIKE